MLKTQVVSIIGPTASGKTGLALNLAKYLYQDSQKQIHIISADSRQVYQDTPILTGADIPKKYTQLDAKKTPYPFFLAPDKSLALHGISILKYDQNWSVGHFQEMTHQVIQANPETKYFLLVGGTGLYHRHLLNPDHHVRIKPDGNFRKKARKMSVSVLQRKLKKLDSHKLANMNNSDRNNPRRLIRAIEIQNFFKKNKGQARQKIAFGSMKHTFVGLTMDKNKLKEKILTRIERRIEQGVFTEVKKIRTKIKRRQQDQHTNQLQITTALGYELICDYLDHKIDLQNLKIKWRREEFQYAQRQMTWFKKNQKIEWFQAKNISVQDVLQFI